MQAEARDDPLCMPADGSWVGQVGRAMAGRVHGLWDNHIVSFRFPKGRVEGRGNMASENEATWELWSRRPDRHLLEDMGFTWPTAGLLQMAI